MNKRLLKTRLKEHIENEAYWGEEVYKTEDERNAICIVMLQTLPWRRQQQDLFHDANKWLKHHSIQSSRPAIQQWMSALSKRLLPYGIENFQLESDNEVAYYDVSACFEHIPFVTRLIGYHRSARVKFVVRTYSQP